MLSVKKLLFCCNTATTTYLSTRLPLHPPTSPPTYLLKETSPPTYLLKEMQRASLLQPLPLKICF